MPRPQVNMNALMRDMAACINRETARAAAAEAGSTGAVSFKSVVAALTKAPGGDGGGAAAAPPPRVAREDVSLHLWSLLFLANKHGLQLSTDAPGGGLVIRGRVPV